MTSKTSSTKLMAMIGPGLLMAATGVGAGDLATGALAGSHVGIAILWAVVVGCLMKYTLNEGLARWQLVTGTTFLEGVVQKLSPWVGWFFLPYFLLWSFFVASALMGACGVTLHAMIPIFDDASKAKVVFGVLASLIGLAMVLAGGYRLMEKVMSVCIVLMFVTVVVTAILVWPGSSEVIQGLVRPSIPEAGGEGLAWTVALIGGVGATLGILCYGYWIREEGRTGTGQIGVCRLDLSLAYVMTAIFGISMVIIGSTVEVSGRGAGLVVLLADQLADPLGPVGRWMFLIGAIGAVFSSLLGVWQAVPYLFADMWRLLRPGQSSFKKGQQVDTRSLPYRGYLFGIAFVPMLGLLVSFKEIQMLYTITGAAFMPLLAIGLLILNGRHKWLGKYRNHWPATAGLLFTLAFFAWTGWKQWFG